MRFFLITKIEYQLNLHFLATGRFCLASLRRVYAQEWRVSRYSRGSRERIIEWNGEEISGTANGKPWEDIQVLSAPALGARLTQDYLFRSLKDLFDQIKDLIKEPLSEAGAP